MRRLRISAISYLNTAPLMWDFEQGKAGSQFEISYTIPSRCGAALAEGSADIGIIPAAAYASIPDLLILPEVAIAARRAVRSILLVSKVPLDQVRCIALDNASMTSVALTKVIFSQWLGGGREFTEMPADLNRMLLGHDAALLIGDPALQVDRARYLTYDLAEEWIRLTRKPFVFAFWAVRAQALRGQQSATDLPKLFLDSRNHGLEPGNLDQIAHQWARRVRLSESDVKLYLTENIHYSLDSQCLEGLQLFYRYASACGALPQAPPLNFLEPANIVVA